MMPHLPETYIVKSELGSGGMADVYLAHNRLDGRDVAIKVPKEAFLDETGRARFVQEARTWAGLEHGAIVRVYKFRAEAETPYIEMQLMTGGSLHHRIQAAVFTPKQALPVIRRIAAALDYAHKKGAVHRDVKPDNVLFDEENNAYLTDFGIVKPSTLTESEETALRLTTAGQIPGTAAYLSPEQINPDKVGVGRLGSGDIYALGIVLFEMLTGKIPYEGSTTVEQAIKHVTEPVPTIDEYNLALPPDTQTLLDNALAKKPAERYASATALADDLERLVNGERVPALTPAKSASEPEPLPVPDAPVPPVQRRYVWLVPLVVVLLGAAFLIGRSTLVERGEEASSDEMATAELAPVSPTEAAAPATDEPTPEVVVVAPVDDPDAGATQASVQPLETVAVSSATTTTVESPVVEDTSSEASSSAPLPNIAAAPDEIVFQSNRDGDYEIFIMAADGSNQRQLTDNSYADRYPRVSPDGRQIVFQSRRNNNTDIFLINRDGSGERRLTVDATLDELPTWSPDGTQIVFNSWLGNNSELFVVDVDGNNLLRLTDSPLDEAHASWSADGRLAFNGTAPGESNFQLYTARADGKEPMKITNSRVDEYSPEWSPDGKRLLFISERDNSINSGIYVMDGDGQNAQLLYNGPTQEWGATWSSDGSQLVFTVDQPDGTAAIYTMGPDGDNPRKLIDRGGYPSWAPAIMNHNEVGERVQEEENRQTAALLSLAGSDLVQLTFSADDDYTPVLSPDQRRLVFSSEIGRHWALVEADVNGGGELGTLASGPFDLHAPQFAPDGLTLLVSSNPDGDFDIHLLDAMTGAFIAQLTDLPGDEYSPHWLPDGTGFVFSAIGGADEGVYVEFFNGERTRLTGGGAFNGFAFPSPDGQHIAFYSSRDGDYEIYIMAIDGQEPTRLTHSSGRDAAAAFSPDGQWIAFESDRHDNNYELYIMRPDGSDVRRLTSNFHGDWFPTFSPDGKWLLFQSDKGGNMNIYRMPFVP